MPRERIVILSDTHLGRPHAAAESAEALRPLWRYADRLIINGDLAELHHPKYQARAAWIVMRLKELCEHDGVRLTLLSGNHDPYLTERRHLDLADGQVFVTHGDCLHPAIAPWSRSAKNLRKNVAEALRRDPQHDQDILGHLLAAYQTASQQECFDYEKSHGEGDLLELLARPLAVPQILWYWLRIPRYAERFVRAHRPHARFFVFGHTHRQGIWQRGGRTLINTGAYGFPAKPRAVVIENNQLHVYPIISKRVGHRHDDLSLELAEKPLVRYPLDPPPDARPFPTPQPAAADELAASALI